MGWPASGTGSPHRDILLCYICEVRSQYVKPEGRCDDYSVKFTHLLSLAHSHPLSHLLCFSGLTGNRMFLQLLYRLLHNLLKIRDIGLIYAFVLLNLGKESLTTKLTPRKRHPLTPQLKI